jgi:LemA protein
MEKRTKIVLIIGIILAAIVAIVVIFALAAGGVFVTKYNTMVTMDEGVKTAWAQVENQLQRRMDLIPNYVETVKGYAKHEREVFIEVTEARAKVGGAVTPSQKIEANTELSAALSRLLLVVERYPDLKANQNFIRLQDELAGTENRIAVERMRYNEAVREYNVYIRRFPNNFVAGFFGFTKATLFEAPEEAKAPPKVKF